MAACGAQASASVSAVCGFLVGFPFCFSILFRISFFPVLLPPTVCGRGPGCRSFSGGLFHRRLSSEHFSAHPLSKVYALWETSSRLWGYVCLQEPLAVSEWERRNIPLLGFMQE